MVPQYDIWVETDSGEIFLAFTWCRDRESGIARAVREAPNFGFKLRYAWAVTH